MSAFQISGNVGKADTRDLFNDQPENYSVLIAGWRKALQKLQSGVTAIIKGITGPLHDIAQNLLSSFQTFDNSLNGLIRCESTMLSSVSIAISAIVNLFSNINGSASKALTELSNGLPRVISSLTNVVNALSEGIGQLTVAIIEAITDVEIELTEVANTVRSSGVLKFGLAKKI